MATMIWLTGAPKSRSSEMPPKSRERPVRCAARAFIRMRIKPAGADIPLNGGVEPLGIECLEPGAKRRQFARRKLFDGLLDVFRGGHVEDITFACCGAKATGRSAFAKASADRA